MNKIIKLKESLINQIQSQVTLNSIESIIKELLQNSLDANATSIVIKLDLNTHSVFIQDNGCGINACDFDKLTLKNYTSKIDQDCYGSKGEALHCLNATSTLSIISKSKSSPHTYKLQNGVASIHQNDNDLPSYFQIPSIQHGTVIIASNCFYNMPVRKQQISTIASYKIIDGVKLVILQSLIKHKHTKLSLFLINHEKFQLDPKIIINNKVNTFESLLHDIYGLKLKFQTIGAKFKQIEVNGVIGKRPINSKSHQYIFINDESYSLNKSESNYLNNIFATSSFIEESILKSPTKSTGTPFYKYVTFLISIKCDKTVEQDSTTWKTVMKILEKVFARFLETNGYGKRRIRSPSPLTSPIKKKKSDQFVVNTKAKLAYYNEDEILGLISEEGGKVNQLPVLTQRKTPMSKIKFNSCDEQVDHGLAINFSKSDLNHLQIIKQVDNKFILALIKEQLVILDQHAIDERIRVEQLLQEFINLLQNENPSLTLETPMRIQLSTMMEVDLFSHHISNFKTFGIKYNIDDESQQITITHLPHILIEKVKKDDDEFLKNSLLQHCYDLNLHYKNTKINLENWFECVNHIPKCIIEIINSKACRSSIMFGDNLTLNQIENLVSQLKLCKLPFICAHGRPSIVPLLKI